MTAYVHDHDTARTTHAVDPRWIGSVGLREILESARAAHARGERVTWSRLSDMIAGRADAAIEVERAREEGLPEDVGLVYQRLRRAAIARAALPAIKSASQALGGVPDADALDDARQSIAAASAALAAVDDDEEPILGWRDICERTASAIVESVHERESGKLIKLGTPTLDQHYLASPGTMTVVGAATNVGKSSILAAWGMSLGSRGIPTGIVSVEDPLEDFGSKALAALGGLRTEDAWQGRYDTSSVVDAGSRAGSLPLSLHLAVVRSRKIDTVLARMEQLVRGHGARVLIVDYLQAIAHRDGKDLRERTDRTLEELIACAGRLGAHLVLASQLTRISKLEKRREPVLNDLKESGSIENRAAGVVLLWRESDEPGAKTLAKLAKSKRGRAGITWTMERDRCGALVECQSTTEDW